MNKPSRSDWGNVDSNDLDAEWSFKQFFGKSFDDAEKLFRENALYYQEDLQSMPFTPFNFYAPAFAKYITSDQAAGDSDGASSFLRLVSSMLKNRDDMFSVQTRQLLINSSAKVADNQQFYDADTDIYGDFSELFAEIEQHA